MVLVNKHKTKYLLFLYYLYLLWLSPLHGDLQLQNTTYRNRVRVSVFGLLWVFLHNNFDIDNDR